MESEKLKKEQLHEYQRFASSFLLTHPVAILLLDMGLGKSVITLTAIEELVLEQFLIQKVLIVAPLRVARDTWPAEVIKWEHLQYLTVSVMVGTEKQRIKALERKSIIYTINRENIPWLVKYYEEHQLEWDFDMLVIDELSSFKNNKSARWKKLKSIRPKFKRVVGLTGTPSPNGLMDLWAEIGILDMGQRLGRFITDYRYAYFRPGSMNPNTGVVFSYELRKGADKLIYDRISDICISMKALDYLDMPECIYNKVEIQMDERERKLYDQMKADLILPMVDGDVEAANAGALSGKLHQMANGAVYDENGTVREIHNKKLEALDELIESANGQSVLVAYWFKHDKDRIIEYFKKKHTPVRELKSSKDMENWCDGKISVALIHPASAGHGLNIQSGGHILIWFGVTWSLELYRQTNARLWRQGQKSVVTIHHILMKDTVDEDVMKALDRKEIRQDDLIGAVKARFYG